LISPDRVGALNAHQDRVRTLSQDVRPSGGPRLEGIVSGWVVLLHVAVAFWFVAGLPGRNLTLARARSSRRIGSVDELVELAGRFDRLMVIPGSLAVLLLGLLAFVPRRRVVDRALADARQLDAVTPALSTALRDRWSRPLGPWSSSSSRRSWR
jgi:hypothetical protein